MTPTKIPKSVTRQVKTMYFYWKLTDYCNFACHYCPPRLHQGKKSRSPDFPNDETIANFIQGLEKYSTTHLVSVTLSGGEPTVHPAIGSIIAGIKKINGFVEVITNGSRPVAWWQQLERLPDRVVISLHPEFTDLERVNKLALFLVSQDRSVAFNLMADPDNWNWIELVQKTLHPQLIGMVDAKLLSHHDQTAGRDHGELYDYTQEQITQAKNVKSFAVDRKNIRGRSMMHYTDGSSEFIRPFAVIRENFNQYLGWSCRAGQEGFQIDTMGKIQAGVCGIRHIGDLKNFAPADAPTICTKKYCREPADINLEKWSD